jgi:hypothetical protein
LGARPTTLPRFTTATTLNMQPLLLFARRGPRWSQIDLLPAQAINHESKNSKLKYGIEIIISENPRKVEIELSLAPALLPYVVSVLTGCPPALLVVCSPCPVLF